MTATSRVRTAAERRGQERLEITLAGRVRVGRAAGQAFRVVDLSIEGLRIRITGKAPKPGGTLRLSLEVEADTQRTLQLQGKAMWVENLSKGCLCGVLLHSSGDKLALEEFYTAQLFA